MANQNTHGFKRPFPALTPSQRYFLDVNGYVVVENTLDEGEVGRLYEALQGLKRDLLKTGEPGKTRVRGCHFSQVKEHYVHFAHILESDPAIFAYLTHPRLSCHGRRTGWRQRAVGGIGSYDKQSQSR